MNASIRAAIAAIPEDAWTAIEYPQAVWDDQLDCWISDAEVAETAVHRVHVEEEGQARHRPADRPPGPRQEQEGRRRARASCSPPGATTPSSPTPRSSWSRPRGSTAATRSSSRSSPTSTAARWPTCHPGISPRTPPGWPSPPWRTTCCAPPAPWPACRHAKARAATDPPRPDRRRRPHRPPRPGPPHPPPARGLAPRAANGGTSSKPPAARPPQRPDQPRPGPHPHAARPPAPAPGPGPGTSRRTVSGRKNTPENPRGGQRPQSPHSAFSRWIEA